MAKSFTQHAFETGQDVLELLIEHGKNEYAKAKRLNKLAHEFLDDLAATNGSMPTCKEVKGYGTLDETLTEFGPVGHCVIIDYFGHPFPGSAPAPVVARAMTFIRGEVV